MFFAKSVPFDPQEDIPSLDGKVVLVTGGNAGLGKQSVLELARHNPTLIWLAARNLERAQKAADDIREQVPNAPIQTLELDLSSFDSVKAAAETVRSSEKGRLDILMLNGGIMAVPPGLTREGYELQFGVNHMGHALLTKLLLPLLLATASGNADAGTNQDVRVVTLTSGAHMMVSRGGFNFNSLKTPAENMNGLARYNQSKLANVLFARHLAKLHPQLTVSAIHPGATQTNLAESVTDSPAIFKLFLKVCGGMFPTVEEGARNQLWACFSEDVQSGEYYSPVGVGGGVSRDGKDDVLAKKLWDWTEVEIKGYSV
ncbi:related to alcohol dehydrogenase homolog Bli-4 [Cephalotrichum gorgonifer]|uniref:Related to alcohol dehydrogenase homolog Bli-4 n=1 Tax=Cephalotrichum gorgonifer TaxID=2041049 RepID=A0AAE8MT24_9PEZI|nr:related to alcohol dehydrogenase homolog Bli-4 [Cephalotrichum gorgonifer]